MRKLLIGGMAALVAITFAPIAHADGNAANLDQLVGQGLHPVPTRLYAEHDAAVPTHPVGTAPPGGQGGSGRIIDGTQGLGGPFKVYWNLGKRSVPWGATDRTGSTAGLLGHRLRVLLGVAKFQLTGFRPQTA